MKTTFKTFLEGKKTILGFPASAFKKVPQIKATGPQPPPIIKGTKRVKDGSFWKLVDQDDPRYKDK